MLFNSHEFIFLFLPLVLIIFYLFRKLKLASSAFIFLAFASLYFYAYWKVEYLILIVVSILTNYFIARNLYLSKTPGNRHLFLIFGVSFNLVLLCYYKYTGFFLASINSVRETKFPVFQVILPIGISFFTFQQIAFLVDVYKRVAEPYSLVNYVLFVTFFPQLIAGPIVHHAQMMPQFERPLVGISKNLSIGVSIFIIGLLKKVVIADSLSVYARALFDGDISPSGLDTLSAWTGVLAYTFQLYFDFSGYSDMAIGLARIFGIVLPENFYSPYKAGSIVEFWRRWHITLSTFLKDYLYIPLGGNKNGTLLRYRNLLITMVIGGLWHGAGWGFVVWGGLHGVYLVINHLWHKTELCSTIKNILLWRLLSWLLTFTAVVIGWVFFRSDSISGAVLILNAMFDFSQLTISDGDLDKYLVFQWPPILDINSIWDLPKLNSLKIGSWILIMSTGVIALLLPNTQQIFAKYNPVIELFENRKISLLTWTPNLRWSILITSAFVLSLLMMAENSSEFLYFQF